MSARSALPSGVAVAILAAGAGTRFGGDKLAAECAGLPLGQWSLRTALALGVPVAVISATAHPSFVKAYEERLTIIPNPSAPLGQGSSVRAAASWAAQDGHERLLLLLADMPLVTTATLSELVNRSLAYGMSACLYPDARRGVPACVGADRVLELARSSDRGLSDDLQTLEPSSLVKPPAAELLDVDTAHDLALIERLLVHRELRDTQPAGKGQPKPLQLVGTVRAPGH